MDCTRHSSLWDRLCGALKASGGFLMYSPSTTALAAVGVLSGLLSGWAIIPTPEHEFMTVHSITQMGKMVVPSRTVYGSVDGQAVLADWRVTVVPIGEDAPTCNTIPGPALHEGWSKYDPSAPPKEPMTLDKWVGDPGCWKRLPPGEYFESTTWTPRDGSKAITYRRTFIK